MNNIQTKRLLLRYRSKEILNHILFESMENQMTFFGTGLRDQIKQEVAKVKKGYSNFKNTILIWDIIDLKTRSVYGVIHLNQFHDADRGELEFYVGEKLRKIGILPESLFEILKFAFIELKLNKIDIPIQSDNKYGLDEIKKYGFNLTNTVKENIKIQNKLEDQEIYTLYKRDFQKRK